MSSLRFIDHYLLSISRDKGRRCLLQLHSLRYTSCDPCWTAAILNAHGRVLLLQVQCPEQASRKESLKSQSLQ